jgi:hypothetical protein
VTWNLGPECQPNKPTSNSLRHFEAFCNSLQRTHYRPRWARRLNNPSQSREAFSAVADSMRRCCDKSGGLADSRTRYTRSQGLSRDETGEGIEPYPDCQQEVNGGFSPLRLQNRGSLAGIFQSCRRVTRLCREGVPLYTRLVSRDQGRQPSWAPYAKPARRRSAK